MNRYDVEIKATELVEQTLRQLDHIAEHLLGWTAPERSSLHRGEEACQRLRQELQRRGSHQH